MTVVRTLGIIGYRVIFFRLWSYPKSQLELDAEERRFQDLTSITEEGEEKFT